MSVVYVVQRIITHESDGPVFASADLNACIEHADSVMTDGDIDKVAIRRFGPEDEGLVRSWSRNRWLASGWQENDLTDR